MNNKIKLPKLFFSYLSELYFSVLVSPLTAPTKQMSGHFTLKTQKQALWLALLPFSLIPTVTCTTAQLFIVIILPKALADLQCLHAETPQACKLFLLFLKSNSIHSREKRNSMAHSAFGLTTANLHYHTRKRMLNSEKRLSDIVGQV